MQQGWLFYSYEVIKIQQYFSFLILYMHFPRTEDTWGFFKGLCILLIILFITQFGERVSSNMCTIIPPHACPWCDMSKFNLVTWAFFKPGNISFL